MTINAVVKRPNLIVANTTALTTTQSEPAISLKNSGISQNYVHNLLDVVEISPQNGDTLVYNANTHKYDVAPVQVTVLSIDGGSF